MKKSEKVQQALLLSSSSVDSPIALQVLQNDQKGEEEEDASARRARRTSLLRLGVPVDA